MSIRVVLMRLLDNFIASIPVRLQLTESSQFEVLRLSSPLMLLLLETFLELLLWNSFQCRRHIFFLMSSVS